MSERRARQRTQRGSMQQGLGVPWAISGAMFGYAVAGPWIGAPVILAIVFFFLCMILGQLLTYEDWGFLLSYVSIVPLITHFFVAPYLQTWILSVVMLALVIGVMVLFVRRRRVC